jgi:hypothetical protein
MTSLRIMAGQEREARLKLLVAAIHLLDNVPRFKT